VAFNRVEDSLLVHCVRNCLGADSAHIVNAIASHELDWSYLTATAFRHGVMPLVYHTLKNTCPDAVPPAALQNLQHLFQANANANLLMTGELIKLLDLFKAHDIVAVPFKGPVLAASAYGDISLRQFVDLDIMVRREDVREAGLLLASLGYQSRIQLDREAELQDLLRDNHQYGFTRNDNRITVEIQWGLAHSYFSLSLDADSLLEFTELRKLAGTPVPNLLPEYMLLILCIHGTKHQWERLEWIADVAQLVRACPNMDWDRVMLESSRAGSERMLLLGLLLSADLLGAVIPETVARKMRDESGLGPLAREVYQQIFSSCEKPPGVFRRSLFHLRAREHLGDRIRYCYRLLTTLTSADRGAGRSSPWTQFIYYPVRTARLIGKYWLRR
jgi:hypothetical protein